MKKFIYLLIYLLGYAVSWGAGYRLKDKQAKDVGECLTYGDVTVVSGLSLMSWISVVAIVIVEISESDFFDKQIDCK